MLKVSEHENVNDATCSWNGSMLKYTYLLDIQKYLHRYLDPNFFVHAVDSFKTWLLLICKW